MTKSRHLIAPKKPWTRHQVAVLRRKYPDATAAYVARLVSHPLTSVYRKAAELRLKKSAAFNASEASGRLQAGSTIGLNGRFKPGHVPANKGLRRPGWARGRMRETQFKKGQRNGVAAQRWLPIGSYRINADGVLDRKVKDSGPPQKRWIGVHRLVWKKAYGRIPRTHAVVFKPGRRSTRVGDITIDALELVSRQELMRRNSYHTNYPKEIGQVIQLRGALQRQINRRMRKAA